MIRVLQFADVVNRHDFVDVIVRHADRSRFLVGVCTRTNLSNIADPAYDSSVPHWVIRGKSRLCLPWTVLNLARLLRSWHADILHTHHYDQAVIGWLATRICPATRLVVGRHYWDSIYQLSQGARRKALLKIEGLSNRAASRIVVPSKDAADLLAGRQGVDPGRIDLVPYAFDPDRCPSLAEGDVRRIRDEFGLEGRFSIGSFGRLHVEKGQHYLLQAVAELRKRVPQVAVLLVGEGPERPSLEKEIRGSGLEHTVRLLGHRRDAMAVMSAVDAVVQPSLHEAFSQVMAESMWMGKPLVMTDVSGAPDVIRDGENGLLVPRANPEALCAAIERLIADPALRDRMGTTGRLFVERNLTVGRIVPRYERCYIQVLDQAAPGGL